MRIFAHPSVMLRMQCSLSRQVIFLFLSMVLLSSIALIKAADVDAESNAESNDTAKDEMIEFPEQHWYVILY